ncbi:MAG TPA: TlpA disulfide reductase family protein [Bryobacteraceae bacterium]|jgi:cytochrome c biogenesis protein CcmG/thiol:disulfide interchange protein DsbE|nr:TlpA disulfide reductase family protein [Bryobacteraceae bacterium]
MKQNRMDLAIKAATGILLVVLAFVIVYSVQDHVVAAGDSAPNFRVKTESGAEMTPTSFGGKVLILNFWASWCAPCVQEIPSLNQIQKMFASQGLVVLGVSVDSKEELYRNMLQRFQITFQTVRDPQENINYRYGTYKVPESYIIDRNGKVLQKYAGLPDVNGEWKVWTDPQIVSYVRSLL